MKRAEPGPKAGGKVARGGHCAWRLCVYLWHDVTAKGAGCHCGAWRLALGLVTTLSKALAHELYRAGSKSMPSARQRAWWPFGAEKMMELAGQAAVGQVGWRSVQRPPLAPRAMDLQTRAQLARGQIAPPAGLAQRTLAPTGHCICMSAFHHAKLGCMHTHAVRLLLESWGHAGPSGAIRVEHMLCRGMPDLHSLVKKTIACRLSDRSQLWRRLQT